MAVQTSGPFPVMVLERGPLYYVQSVFVFFCLAASAVLFLKRYRLADKEARHSLNLAVIAAILPCIGMVLIAFNTASIGLDFATFFFPVSCLLLLISIFKFQFLNLKPLVYKRVFESSGNGIIVLKENMIMDFNDAAAGIFAELNKNALYKNVFSVLGIYEPLLSAVAEKKEEQIEVCRNDKSRYYYITVSNISNTRVSAGILINLTDITRNIEVVKVLEKSEQKNRLLLTQMRQGLVVCEMVYKDGQRNFICIDENPAFEAITGFKRQDIQGNSIFKLYPDMKNKLFTRFEDVCITGRSYQTEYMLPEKGNYLDIVLYSPQPRHFAMIISDITERKEMYDILKEQRAVLTAIAKASSELLSNRGMMSALAEGLKLVGLATDADKVSLYVNQYDNENLRYIAHQEIEWDSSLGATNMNPAELESFSLEELDDFTRSLAMGKPFTNLVGNLPKSDTKKFFESNRIKSYLIFPLFSEKNFWGFVAFYNCRSAKIWTNSEISILELFASAMSGAVERNSFEKKIEVLSYHDQLTGLFNRRFFEEEVKRLDTKRNLPLTIVIADVNGLKLTNDAFGHFLGDKLLQKAAEVFHSECRADDIIARIGGDEFAILLPKTDSRETMRIVHRIQNAILEDTTENIILSISFGFSTKYETEESMTELIKKAEDHMYNNKLSEGIKIRSRTLEIIKKKLYGRNEREQRHSECVRDLCKEIGIAMHMNQSQLD
ncbi:MAG: diguanylate cyclase, partial [Eubacteriales bacterium]